MRREKRLKELERINRIWGPRVDVAVQNVVVDEWLIEIMDAAMEQAATDILIARVNKHNAAEKAKREQLKARQADEAAKAKTRDELKNKREKERKAKAAKEKAEMAALKKEFGK